MRPYSPNRLESCREGGSKLQGLWTTDHSSRLILSLLGGAFLLAAAGCEIEPPHIKSGSNPMLRFSLSGSYFPGLATPIAPQASRAPAFPTG
jgi:hypothetical protein